MEWNGPPLQEWEIHSYLVLPACSIFFSEIQRFMQTVTMQK